MLDFEQVRLDFRAKIPLYVQLSEQIRAQVEQGALQADEQLPPVRSLAERLRVNFNTVARAYRILDIEGWISTQQGRGTYITPQSWPRSPVADDLNISPAPTEDPIQPVDQHTEELPVLAFQPADENDETLQNPLPDEINQPDHQAEIARLLAWADEQGITLQELQASLQAQLASEDPAPPARSRPAGQQRADNFNRKRRLPSASHLSKAQRPVSRISSRLARHKKRNPVI